MLKIGVKELLHEAAMGRAGADRRLIQSILDNGSAAEVLRFASASRDNHRLDIDPFLIDLLRHFRSDEALSFFIDALRRAPEDVSDELIQALLPFRHQAVGPLLDLYEELGEEQGSDVSFLLAALRVPDPRVLARLLERLEYDAADGAFCLGLYGDPAARPHLSKMLAEISPADAELQREFIRAIEQLDAPEPPYETEPFDIVAEYPARELPAFDLLPESERIEMLGAEDPEVRAGAAHSFFSGTLNSRTRAALLAAARSDPDPRTRGRAWESLGSAVKDTSIREVLIATLNDASKTDLERGGAAIGLYSIADRDEVRRGIEALYQLNGAGRAKALEAMWRSLWEPYARYFPQHLEDTDPEVARQALRGAGYFRLTRYADKIASFFDREGAFSKLREDALFAYALAMPGETTRGRVRGMLRKINALAGLTDFEMELVEFALDERLRLHGLDPVFAVEENPDLQMERAPFVQPPQKAGRNDPCPCGSGKKYKKCCGKAA